MKKIKLKKITLCLMTVLVFNIQLFTFCCIAQTPNWQWAQNNGGLSADYAQGVATDNFGNVYVVGAFQSATMNIGITTLTNNGDFDVYIAKYDASGNPLWAKSAGGSAMDYGYGIATDKAGNIYITGWFNSPTISFETKTLTNAGVGSDIFLVKYDSSGNVLWAKREGGTTGDIGYGIATDSACNICIAGEFQSTTMTIGTDVLTNAGGIVPNDIFIAKYDSAGNAIWAKSAGGTGSDFGSSVTVDNSGNSYLTGNFSSGFINFGLGPLTNNGVYDMFLVKFNPSGTALWQKVVGGSAGDSGNSVAVDYSGNVYVSGVFESPTLGFGLGTLINAGGRDVFVAKYSNAGIIAWSNSIGGNLNDESYSLAADKLSNVYVSGAFQSSNLVVGGTPLTNSGNYDIFVVKYDSVGTSLWAKSAGGSGYEYAYSICNDTLSNIYLSGYFSSPSLTLGNTLTNAGGCDGFITKLAISSEVNTIENKMDISIFPNPTLGQINFQMDYSENVQVTIFNVLGKCIYTNYFDDSKCSIDLNAQPAGIYFIKIKSENNIITKKIIIQK